ncbi:protein PALS2 isoform X1 [Culex pipiens pallens]|uniref:protein PALS2 isoform X1 n=1 Tax=Culex pipiens pallens TaxID=42434 RepID=UPI001954E542|nr:protein PALS2 isoform X1 [Culex pipiens pallens]
MVQSYEVRARESPHRNSTFVNNFKSLFRRRSRKTGSPKRPPVVKPQDPKAPIADPEASEPSSLISSTSSPPAEENNNQNSGISIPEDSNRYEIRKPVKRKSVVVAPAVRPRRKPGVQHRRSFGRRINNLWSSFGLLRSSEKIVEFASGYAAFQHVRENLDDLNGKSEANETDLVFLQGILENPAVTQVIKIQDKLEDVAPPLKPVRLHNIPLLREVIDRCSLSRNPHARELARIFRYPHFRALVETHDEVGEVTVEQLKHAQSSPGGSSQSNGGFDDSTVVDSGGGGSSLVSSAVTTTATGSGGGMPGETIKMVGIRRNPNEPLGLTVEVDEHNQLVVARIIAGGMIDRQGLLHPGDVILEVNGSAVTTPEELQTEISRAKESVTLKIGPSIEEEMKSARIMMAGGQVKSGKNLEAGKKLTCYMRALFDYDPTEDNLLPCQEIGLSFQRGDILQIINVKDPNWWQARHAGEDGPIGLIPSQELEERRQAYVPPEADFVHKISICGTRISKKKRKTMYKTKQNGEFDKADLMLYEEVTKMPPFKRKTLVLIGVSGVGRRTLKNRLINSDPDKFASVLPHTSRPPRPLEESGKAYWFTEREDMEQEIKENRFLEFGEHNGNLYGTHLDSIRDIIRSGKMCVLDCAPSALKILHNSAEFMPYVIFVASPGMEQLKQLYAERRSAHGSQRSLQFDRQSSIRFSSRRAKTLESLASLYEDDDLISAVEESALLQRKYDKYLDMVIVNEDFDVTFRAVTDALEALSHEHQWVPVNWIY